MDSHCH